MKKFKLIYLLLFSTLIACDTSTDPNDFFAEDANGAWLRTVALSPNFNLNDIDSAFFEVTLEENDEEDGALLSSVNVYASFIDNTVESDNLSVAEVLFTTFSASDFDTSSGKPVITHNITALEVANFLDIDPVNLAPTDLFVFRYELLLTDGRMYSVSNSGTNVLDATKPFFNSPFSYNAPLVCPVEDTFAVGTYVITTTIPGAFGASFDETVEVTIGSSATKRTFMADWFPALGFGNTAPYQFDLVCGNVIFDNNQSSGLGCAGSLVLGTGATNTTYDETDDSVILINFAENIQGDCGAPTTQNQIMLTKVQ